MSDRELLALMTSVMMRDSVTDAFQKALAALRHVDEHLQSLNPKSVPTNVPMSRPPVIKQEEEEDEEAPTHRRRAK